MPYTRKPPRSSTQIGSFMTLDFGGVSVPWDPSAARLQPGDRPWTAPRYSRRVPQRHLSSRELVGLTLAHHLRAGSW